MTSLGVDIGATKINFVLLKNNRVLKSRKVLTPKIKKELIKILKENIKDLVSSVKPSDIRGIGIGVPGPLNKKGDLVLNPPNLRYLSKVSLSKIMEKELSSTLYFRGKRVFMENDANCFVLGEAILGAGKGAKSVFGITLGSGLGGGLAINGKIYQGAFGSAGEAGHMVIKFDGPKCSCGSFGCFEGYCSEKFFKKYKISPKDLLNKAIRGNKTSLRIFSEYGKYVGLGLGNIINLIDPEVVVVGGGIANAYKFFELALKSEMKKRVISPVSKKYVKIKRSKLGDFAGAIGAALLVNKK